MGRPVNVITIESIEGKASELLKVRDKLSEMMQYNTDKLINEILVKYIETQSVVGVANYLNSKGHRVQGRKYFSNDISEILKSKDIDGNKELFIFAKALFNYNKGKTSWGNLVRLSS